MLGQDDIKLLKGMMESVIDERLSKTENFMLDEIGRTQVYLENKINKVQKNLEELNQYYRITKLENDNTALLLKMIDELSKRVEELEKKTAQKAEKAVIFYRNKKSHARKVDR